MHSNDSCFDVIVVGGGGSGLAAAIEARAAGRTVLLLEKNARLGGSTAWSVGSVSSSQTPHQRRQGIVDCPEDHWADMPGFAGNLQPRDNDELRKVLCDGIPDTFAWLLESGVRFMGPMPEPPHRKPRMHNVLPNSRSFIHHLGRRARRAGVDIRTGVQVTRIVRYSDRVEGVVIRNDAGETVFTARNAVVLATGDFTSNPEYKARFMGPQEAKVEAVNATATGDGQRMGEALGARILNGDLAQGPDIRFAAPATDNLLLRLPPWRWLAGFMQWSLDHLPAAILRPFMMRFLTTALAPSVKLFEEGALLVNNRGERTGDELHRPAWRLPEQPDKQGYILLDRALAEQFSVWPNYISTAPGIAYAYVDDYRKNRRDIFNEAPTLEALATRIGMDPETLAACVASATVRKFGEGPYIALGPVRSVFVHSEGGLAVDNGHGVLDSDGRAIPGLYAAGSTGQGGLLLKGHGHHLAWAFVSGRRAGRLAALATAAPASSALGVPESVAIQHINPP